MERGIIILDFGSQYTQLIARRIRELGVYSEIHPYSMDLEILKKLNPYGIILSGGPSSILDKDAPITSSDIFNIRIPILGVCYGMQLMTKLLGGKVERSTRREYGKAILNLEKLSPLFENVKTRSVIWMSHGDSVINIPDGFQTVAKTLDGVTTAIENRERGLFAVQFHPEVVHTEEGKKIISNFIFKLCGAKANWSMQDFVAKEIDFLQEKCGGKRSYLGSAGVWIPPLWRF